MDAIIGVLVGGLIASIIPLITLRVNSEKWRKEKRILYLEQKKQKLEIVFNELNKDLFDALAGNKNNSKIVDYTFLCPGNVLSLSGKIFNSIVDGDSEKASIMLSQLNVMMGDYLKEIDKEIDQALQ